MYTGGLPIMPDIRSLKKGCHLLLEATFKIYVCTFLLCKLKKTQTRILHEITYTIKTWNMSQH